MSNGSIVLRTLLSLNFNFLNEKALSFEERNKSIKVPKDNTPTTLHIFNMSISELYTEAEYEFGRARAYKDAIERLIESTLRGNYSGKNEAERKSAAYFYCQHYPSYGFAVEDTVNLFDLEYLIHDYFNSLEATIKGLNAKSSARITSNSLLNIDRALLNN